MKIDQTIDCKIDQAIDCKIDQTIDCKIDQAFDCKIDQTLEFLRSICENRFFDLTIEFILSFISRYFCRIWRSIRQSDIRYITNEYTEICGLRNFVSTEDHCL